MTPDEFRRLALKLDGAVEGAHMDHPDFRANGRIFATLYPDGESGMVKLTPDQQQDFIGSDSATFAPASGAWGRQGCTTVSLAAVDDYSLGEAMTLAWQNTVKACPKSEAQASDQTSEVATAKAASVDIRGEKGRLDALCLICYKNFFPPTRGFRLGWRTYSAVAQWQSIRLLTGGL